MPPHRPNIYQSVKFLKKIQSRWDKPNMWKKKMVQQKVGCLNLNFLYQSRSFARDLSETAGGLEVVGMGEPTAISLRADTVGGGEGENGGEPKPEVRIWVGVERLGEYMTISCRNSLVETPRRLERALPTISAWAAEMTSALSPLP